MNYRDWLSAFGEESGSSDLPDEIELDYLFLSTVLDGMAREAVEFPREWPSQWLGEAIPEYTGTGWMFDIFMHRPPMSYAVEDVRYVAITMYDFLPQEVDAYMDGLLSIGFEEAENEGRVLQLIEDGLVESARSFRGEGCTLMLMFAFGNGDELIREKPLVQFSVHFDRDPYMLDFSPTAGTELMNIEQWDALTGEYAGRPPKTNQVGMSEAADGFQYEMIMYPSQWPKEFFGNLIPEYVFPATLFYMVYSMPEENPLPEEALDMELVIINLQMEHVETYARELVGFGYYEVAPENYTQDDALVIQRLATSRVFALPSLRVYLATAEVEELGPLLTIYMRFLGR